MKKINKIAMIGALAGIMVVGGVTAVANANGNAYENFKRAAMNTMQQENMTTTTEFTLKQDGQVIAAGNGVSKIDDETHYSTNSIQAAGQTVEMESSGNDESTIVRIDDQYYSYSYDDYGHDSDSDEDYEMSENDTKMMNAMTDLLTGDTKAYFTGGGDKVSLNLEGAQVPEILNIAVGAMVDERDQMEREIDTELPDSMSRFHDIFKGIPITSDATITRISMDTKLSGGQISGGTSTIVITGKDDSGAAHEVEVTIVYTISDVGSTTPGTIDTTGKTVIESPIY